jgi:hypothetical protein
MNDTDLTYATPAAASAPVGEDSPVAGPEGQTTRQTVPRAELEKVIRERQAAKQRARSAEAQLAELRRRLGGGTGLAGGTGFQPVAGDEAGLDISDANLAQDDRGLPQGESSTIAPADADDDVAAAAATAPGDSSLLSPADAGDDVAAAAATAPNSSAPAAEESAAAPSPDRTLRRRLAARERQLAAQLRDQRLRSAAQTAGAVNPDQVVSLLRQRVRMVESAGGQYAACFLDEHGRMALDEAGKLLDAEGFVRAYLSRPENANLVRAGSSGGSGARLAGSAATPDALPLTLADFKSLDPRERRKVALKLSRRQREALLGLSAGEGTGYL